VDSLTPQQGQQGPQFILANQEEESGFDFWGVLNRRKWLVFLGLVTGMALGGLYHAQAEQVFESTAKVKIEPKNPVSFRMTSTDRVGPNMLDFVTRHDRFIGQFNIVSKCVSGLLSLESFETIPEDKVVEYVMENLEATPDREEPILYELVYNCKTAIDAQTVLNNLIATYRDELDEAYKSKSDEYTILLQTVRSEFDSNYLRLTKELAIAQENHKAPTIDGSGTTIHHVALRDLSQSIQLTRSSISDLSSERERINSALAQGEEAINTLLWNLIQQGRIRDLSRENNSGGQIENTINQLLVARGEMKQQFGDSHPRVKAIDAQLDFWRNQLEQQQQEEIFVDRPAPAMMLQRHLLSLDQEIVDLQANMDKSLNDYAMHDAEASRLAGVSREIRNIENQLTDVSEFIKMARMKIYETDPSGDLNSTGRHEGFIFDVLMNATYGQQIWPYLPVILGIGGLLGSLAGFGLGCLVELADKTFHNPDEIIKQLQVPLIGHIPVIGQSKRYLVENSLIDPIVCTYHRPKSQVSESFRAVRTSLYFNSQGKTNSVIQITSPTPGDGKSTLASNLAVSIAQSGKRVLLVDGDMRRPRQATTFGITSKTGFATVLSGVSHWRDVVYECEEIEGLTVMPCGSKPNNPAELSSSPQVKDLIAEMRLEFDFVIIDTPPLLAVTDACPIAARVDGVILCIRIKKNVRVSAERATELLTNIGANCIGLVVNGVGAQSGYGSQYTYGAYRAGYSYNGYGYGYGYGYGAGKYYDDDKSGTSVPGAAPIKHIEAHGPE
jgi:succinoglycan biosynthesis transport protein ExoP